jgi:hypothetical protein
MAENKGSDLLTRDLSSKIEEIIQVDQAVEQSVYTEITEYIATDSIHEPAAGNPVASSSCRPTLCKPIGTAVHKFRLVHSTRSRDSGECRLARQLPAAERHSSR